MPGPFTSAIGFGWDANTEPDVAGYKVYAGRSSGVYGTPVNVGNVTSTAYTINANGLWYFAVTAYDSTGNESGFSTEISKSFLMLGNF